MKMLFVICALIISSASFASGKGTKNLFPTSINTDFKAGEDSLCFSNHDFYRYTLGHPLLMLLGKVADSEGACQGMVGVAAAVKMKVVFRPDHKKMSLKKVKKQIQRAVRLHQNNCSGKVYIDGHENLNQLCGSSEGILKQRSLLYNLSLARKEILKYSYTFFFDGPLSTPEKSSAHILKHLKSMYADLKLGRYPLMLVRKHVTLVTGFDVVRYPSGNVKQVTLKHYDPNVIMSSERDFRSRSYRFSEDGSKIEGTLIWNITPRPLTRLYCNFIHNDL